MITDSFQIVGIIGLLGNSFEYIWNIYVLFAGITYAWLAA